MATISVRLEGGPQGGTAMSAYSNVHTIFYGNPGEEHVYKATDRVDSKGRKIFESRGDLQPKTELPHVNA